MMTEQQFRAMATVVRRHADAVGEGTLSVLMHTGAFRELRNPDGSYDEEALIHLSQAIDAAIEPGDGS